jgi:hypothetical protein
MVACARFGDGWALLMHDVSKALEPLPRWTPEGLRSLKWTDARAIIGGLPAMHAQFHPDTVMARSCSPPVHRAPVVHVVESAVGSASCGVAPSVAAFPGEGLGNAGQD